MDRTIAVMVIGSVLLILGVVVVSVFQAGVGGFKDDAGDIEDQGCSYQQKEFIENTYSGESGSEVVMSDNCKGKDWERDKKRINAMYRLNS